MGMQLRKVIKICIILMVMLSFIAPASASPGFSLESLKNWLFPQSVTHVKPLPVEQSTVISPYSDKFKALDDDVERLATKDNLDECYAVMNRLGYTAVRVDVVDEDGTIKRTYCLVRNGGVVESYTGVVDKTFTVTYDEAINIRNMVDDGEVTFNDRVKIGSILSGNPEFIQYFKLKMYGGF